MTEQEFESGLDVLVGRLTQLASIRGFASAHQFEQSVREEAALAFPAEVVTPPGNGQAFPDIAIGSFGIEVKFTEGSSWRCVANSVLESDRREGVRRVYLVYAKMAHPPQVRWRKYEDAVIHVRTSHVPRFEVDMEASRSLFDRVEVPYERFRVLEMHEKMSVIRKYAKETIQGTGRRLWWIEDDAQQPHSLAPDVRLYTSLSDSQKLDLRGEAAFVSPKVVGPSGQRGKYDDAAIYLLTYHGVICTQVRDLFSAGSVAMRSDSRRGGLYIDRALRDIEPQILAASVRVPDSILREYWGVDPPARADRLRRWLQLADGFAHGWQPSAALFRGESRHSAPDSAQ